MNNLVKKKILILGGEGFIGRNIAKHLSNDYMCFSVGIEKSIFNNRNDFFIQKNPYQEEIPGEYDVIIHLIDNIKDQDEFEKEELNLIKNIKLINAKHYILFSSSVIYANPDSLYAKRKVMLENIYIEYCKKNNLKLTIFRLFNIYGEYQIPQRPGSLVANLMTDYINNAVTEINDVDTKRDFIFARDVVKFIDFAIKNEYFGIIDLATNKLTSIKELIAVLEKEVLMDKLSINIINNKSIICPLAKNELINQVELTTMAEGLRKTFDFYKDNLLIFKEK